MDFVQIGQLPETPLGNIWVGVRQEKLIALAIGRGRTTFQRLIRDLIGQVNFVEDTAIVTPFLDQIQAYFAGERRTFDMPIDWSVMKPYQAAVLRLVDAIPYGKTRTYGDIAHELGDVNGARAVGHANATNPIPIVIPCHRVIGSNNKLTGYNAPNGIVTKEWLLHLEGRIPARQLRLF